MAFSGNGKSLFICGLSSGLEAIAVHVAYYMFL
jgi:hypothetical protein